MAAYRVKVSLKVPTQAVGETIVSALATFIATKPKLATDTAPVAVFDSLDGAWTVRADVRLTVKADAQAWVDDVKAKWGSGPMASKILAGSSVSIHRCPHDEPEGNWYPCSDVTLAGFEEAVK